MRWNRWTKENKEHYWWCPRCGEIKTATPLDDPKVGKYLRIMLLNDKTPKESLK